MTRALGTHATVKVMVPASVEDRIEFACSRDRMDRGDWLLAVLKFAIAASERGQPIISKGNLT